MKQLMDDRGAQGAASRREQEILGILADSLGVPVSSTSEDLIDSGLLDSLAFVDLLFRIETLYATQIDVASLDLDDLRTVSRIAALVDASASGA